MGVVYAQSLESRQLNDVLYKLQVSNRLFMGHGMRLTILPL